jgi:hypothetical protein
VLRVHGIADTACDFNTHNQSVHEIRAGDRAGFGKSENR